MRRIKFSSSGTDGKRKHYLRDIDVEIILSRLPKELWSGLRAVHFNDRSFGARTLGYVTAGRKEIAICALPIGVSLTRFLLCPSCSLTLRRQSPNEFGAERGRQWPEHAIRRFMLYEVFLHELGHLQIVVPNARRTKRRFAGETKAEEFAAYWRKRLWSEYFDYPDPIHNPPFTKELELCAQASGGEL